MGPEARRYLRAGSIDHHEALLQEARQRREATLARRGAVARRARGRPVGGRHGTPPARWRPVSGRRLSTGKLLRFATGRVGRVLVAWGRTLERLGEARAL